MIDAMKRETYSNEAVRLEITFGAVLIAEFRCRAVSPNRTTTLPNHDRLK